MGEDWSRDVETTAKALESISEDELKAILPDRERMSHRIMKDETSTTVDDMTKGGELVPDDFYTNPEYYANLNDPTSKESWAVIKTLRGNPEAEVTIYRSAPKDTQIGEGDWVSLSKKYAKQEGEHATDETLDMPVHSIKVKAKEIVWDGNDINEFAYYPENPKSIRQKISEQYHKGENPELKGAIERMLGNPEQIKVEPVQNESPKQKELTEQQIAGMYRDWETDRKSTRLNSSHSAKSRMPSSA